MMKVGIEQMTFYTAPTVLPINQLAAIRQKSCTALYQNLGQYQMSIASPDQDCVTLAATAAERLLKIADINLSMISLLLFSTESAIDHSKSAGVYLHKLLKLSPHCRVLELKQACYSATGGLQLALNYIQQHSTEKVLLIASDIAFYQPETTAEFSQGAAAVAILISNQPKLLSIELNNNSGFYTQNYHDFWRPLSCKIPYFNGRYSSTVYLKLLLEVWQHYHKNNSLKLTDHQAFLYHVPVPRLVETAHQHLFKANQIDLTRQMVKDQLSAGLCYPREIGNCYTASLYISLISLLENSEQSLEDRRILLFSFGSGATAECFSGVVSKNYYHYLDRDHHQIILLQRACLSIKNYRYFLTHALKNFTNTQNQKEITYPQYSVAPYRLAGIKNQARLYKNYNSQEKVLCLPNHYAIAPAKLILSGEYSVLFGQPALGVAVNRYFKTTIYKYKYKNNNKNNNLLSAIEWQSFNLNQLHHPTYLLDLSSDLSKKSLIDAIFNYFLNKKININKNINYQLKTILASTIPLGSGLGSSAALTLTLSLALIKTLNLNYNNQKLLTIARSLESLQHHQSSGFDLEISLNGGLVFRVENTIKNLTININQQFWVVDTGRPTVTTKNCVAHVLEKFNKPKYQAFWGELGAITLEIQQSITQNNNNLINLIKINHKLLTQLGIIPSTVNNFIKKIETLGGAAKITGAGAIEGETAGMVWVILPDNNNINNNIKLHQKFADLCDSYNYRYYQFSIDPNGLQYL